MIVTEQERARRTVINAMAQAMAHQKGRQWNRMTAARQGQMRRQARAALLAFCPGSLISAYEDGRIADAVAQRHQGSDPRALEAVVSAWIDEVLS